MNEIINYIKADPLLCLTAVIIILLITSLILLFKNINIKHEISETNGQLKQLRDDFDSQIIECDSLRRELSQCNQKINEQIGALSKAQTTSDLYHGMSENLQKEIKAQRDENDNLKQTISELKNEASKSQLRLDEARMHAENLEKALQEAMANFKTEIAAISKNIVFEGTKNLNEQNKQSMENLLDPLNKKFIEFKEEIQKTRDTSIKNQTSLSAQIINLQEAQIKLGDEANKLSRALHDQKKTQGMWGELVLEKVLEASGLRKNIEYEREVVLKNDEQANQRPDAIIRLPNNRELIIDAKCSLNDFINYVNSDDPALKDNAVQLHVQAIKRHIKTLSERYYPKLQALNSPNLVFMFIPSEGPFEVAIENDPSIIDYALKLHIAITTPSTLLSSLAIAKELWELENRNKKTEDLINRIQKIYDKLRCFLENFVKVGNSISIAQNSFEEAKKQLCLGKGNLVSQGKAIAQMLNAEKNFPQELLNIMDYSNNNIEYDVSDASSQSNSIITDADIVETPTQN